MEKPDTFHSVQYLLIMMHRLGELLVKKGTGKADLGDGYEAVELAEALFEGVKELYPEAVE